MIHQVNPKASFDSVATQMLAEIQRVMESGNYILGAEVEAFERNFATWCGAKHGIGCSNGTDAIELIIRALELTPEHVVFTVSHTAVATVAALYRAGVTPWLVDIDEKSMTMCPEALEESILNCLQNRRDLQPKAILPVHLYGQPSAMSALKQVAGKYDLLVLEDCAQSHGAAYEGQTTGTIGQASAFSFYPTKNLGACGDAGLVLTGDDDFAEKLTFYRQYGWKERNCSLVRGINSRLDPIQAVVLNLKLKRLTEDNAARQRLALLYDRLLAPLLEAGLLKRFAPSPGTVHVYHQYVVRSPYRDKLRDFCAARNIATAVHYPWPVHLQAAYSDQTLFPFSGKSLPRTEAAAREVLSLPMYPQLSEDDVRTVARAIIEWGEEL